MNIFSKTINIDLSKDLAQVVSSRDLVVDLESKLAKLPNKKINLDFTNIIFVSRSAAHELILMQERLSEKFLKRKLVNFVNMNEDIKNLINHIAKANPEREVFRFNVKKVDTANFLK